MAIKLKIPTSRTGASGKGRKRLNDPVVKYAFLGFISLSLLFS